MKNIKDFTNQYSISKTLRFGLEPVGCTEEYIRREQVLENDERLKNESNKVKEFIDRFHHHFINTILNEPLLKVHSTSNDDSLEDFADCYFNDKSEKRDERLEKIQDTLRLQIANGFERTPIFKVIGGEKMITEILPEFLTEESEKELVKRFKGFTTYFRNFNTNRKRIYTKEAKTTAIAYRLINQNLNKFINNIAIFDKIAKVLDKDIIAQLDKDFEPYLNVHGISDLFNIENYNEVLTQDQIEVYNAIIGGRVDKDSKTVIRGLNQHINEYNQTHDKSERLPKLNPLFKQILSETVGVSFKIDKFDNAEAVAEAINYDYSKLNEEVLPKLENILNNLDNYDIDGIYLTNKEELSTIAQRIYGSWDKIKNALIAEYDKVSPPKKGQKTKTRETKVNKYLKSIKSISIGKIDGLLKEQTVVSIVDYFKAKGAVDTDAKQCENLFAMVKSRYETIKTVLNSPSLSKELLYKNRKEIKDFLDTLQNILHFVKPLNGCGN